MQRYRGDIACRNDIVVCTRYRFPSSTCPGKMDTASQSSNPLLKEFQKVVEELIAFYKSRSSNTDDSQNTSTEDGSIQMTQLDSSFDLPSRPRSHTIGAEGPSIMAPTVESQSIPTTTNTTITQSNQSPSIASGPKYQRFLNRLCYLMERILEYGLKDVSFFGVTYFWNYLENLDKCLPGNEGKDVVAKIRALNKGNMGRGRVFLRYALNEGAVGDYLAALVWNKQVTKQYYRDTSILCNDEQGNIFLGLLDELKQIKFKFDLTDKSYDSYDYWAQLTARQKAEAVKRIASSASTTDIWDAVGSNAGNSNPYATLRRSSSQRGNSLNPAQLTKELEETKKAMWQMQSQLEIERREKQALETKCRALEEETSLLQRTVGDLQIELEVYKADVPAENTTMDQTDANGQSISFLELSNISIVSDDEISTMNIEEEEQTKKVETLLLLLTKASKQLKEIKDEDQSIIEKIIGHSTVDNPVL